MFYYNYKTALRMNRRSVRTVNAVDFLFSPHDATPSLCRLIEYCLLASLPEENTRGLTSRGSKHEYFPAGVLALPQIRFPVREALEVLKYPFCKFLLQQVIRYLLSKLKHISR